MRTFHTYIIYGLFAVLFTIFFIRSCGVDQNSISYDEVTVQQADGEEVTLLIPGPKVKIFELPKELNFAKEPVPIDQDDILERFEREIYVNAYWQSNMILLMKRANKFLPEIEATLKKAEVPEDFKYLAIAESGLLNVTSPAGARGFWQFMPETAKEYQLEISDDVDERYHLEKSTIAAGKYLKKSYARFGSWTSVAASYNMGISGYTRRRNEQKLDSYYDLFLNEETSRYIFRLLAFKEIFEKPQHYGFYLSEEDFYKIPNFKTLKIDRSIPDLADWALQHQSNYKQLKIHNPWLRSGKLPVTKGKEYYIKLPL